LVNQYEVGRLSHWPDLSRRSDADEQLAAGGKQFFGNQHGKRSAYGTADQSKHQVIVLKLVKLRMVAGPRWVKLGFICSDQVAYQVAIGSAGGPPE
jgi:hypothetical protein